MKRIFTLILVLGLSVSMTSFAEEQVNTKPSFTRLDKIIAIVNREIITQSNYNKELEQLKKQAEHTNQPLPPENQLKKMVMDNLIAKSLQMQLAKSKNIKVTDEDLDKAFKTIAKANNITIDQLKEALKQTGVSWDEYKVQIHDQLMLQKIQQEEIAKTVTLTPEDVIKFKRENRDKFSQYNSYHIIDILLPVAETSNQTQDVKKQATEMVQKLQATKEVEDVLKQYPTAEKNDLGWRSIGEMPSLFQSRVAAMKVNNVTSPFQAPNGFHILKLLDAKGEGMAPSENDIKNMTFQNKINAAIKDWVKKLRQDSYVKIMN